MGDKFCYQIFIVYFQSQLHELYDFDSDAAVNASPLGRNIQYIGK